MRLALSSAAATDAPLEDLVAACARRGLEALELRAGDAHGIDVASAPHAVAAAAAAGVRIATYRVCDEEADAALVALAGALGATLLVSADERLRAERLRAAGAAVAVVVSGADAIDQAHAAAAASLPVAWDVHPAAGAAGERAAALLAVPGIALLHICLFGGGPELMIHEGRGLGELMGRLALAGYTGTLAVAPSSPQYRVVWQQWLGRRGGTGCGSKASDPLAVRALHTA